MGCTHLLHHDVPSDHHFPNGFSITCDVFHYISPITTVRTLMSRFVVQLSYSYFVGIGECVTLSGYNPGSFLERKGKSRRSLRVIITGEWTVCLQNECRLSATRLKSWQQT